jgi:acyl-CoA thioesterase FadM
LNVFDEVRVDMRLKALTADRIELGFEYWLCKDGAEELAAIGEQEIACTRRGTAGPTPCPIPEPLALALRMYAAR